MQTNATYYYIHRVKIFIYNYCNGDRKKNHSLLAILNTLKTGNAYCITLQYNKKKGCIKY